jgi:ribosomal protein L16/L10AE
MILSPRKIKFQKHHSRNDNTKSKQKLQNPSLGYFSVVSEESGKINARQIEAIKLFLRKKFKRQAKV